nr:Holliday junction resolvase RuvX [candidate division Zixibacteria bacterium]
MTNGPYLGIDYGERRIGLARSDATGLIATAYKTITFKSIKKAIKEIVADINEFEIVGVVVGYPLSPDGGQSGERCRMVDEFVTRLEKNYHGPIYRYDERFSSAEAGDIIHRHNKKIGRDKARVDRLAAAIILQRFLDEQPRPEKG